VEHVYSSQKSVETPWRTAAIVAAAVAALELFVLIIVGVVFGAKLVTDRAESAVRAPRASAAESESARPLKSGASTKQWPQKTAPVAELPRSRTSVIVLNGNGLSGAASVGAERVRGFHYLIAATGNAPRTDFQRSIVMYRPGFKGEATRLAHDLHVRRVTPLDGLTRRDLQGAHLAYVIGG
jgi:hypothetical protein